MNTSVIKTKKIYIEEYQKEERLFNMLIRLVTLSILTATIVLTLISPIKASGPSESWMRAFGTTNYNDHPIDVKHDSNNNIFLLGRVANYNGNPYSPDYYDSDFNDDDDATDTAEQGIPNSTYHYNLFIDSFDTAGNHRWAKRFLNDSNPSFSIDSSNHLAIFAIQQGNQDLNADGDVSDTNETSGGLHTANDFLLTIFDSNGNYLWSQRYGSANHDLGNFTIDSNGNVIIAGYVTGDADLTGDADADDGQGESSSGYGDKDIVVISISPTGARNWSKRLGGTSVENFYAVYVDSEDNIYVSGSVTDDADLNGDGDTADSHETDGTGNFTSIFDQDGNFISTLRVGGDLLETDNIGNLIIAGECNGDIDLSNDGDTNDTGESSVGYGLYDICISSFDRNSIAYNWSRRLGGTGNDSTREILISNSGNKIILGVYLVGNADTNGDGDSSDGGAESQGVLGGRDLGILVFDSSGTYLWSKRLGTNGDDNLQALEIDSQDSTFATLELDQDKDADLNGDGDTSDSADGEILIGHTDISLSEFSSSGSFTFAKRFGTTGQDGNLGISINNMNDLILWGDYAPTLAADLNGDGDMTDGTVETGTDTYKGLFITYFQTDNHITPDTTAPTGSIIINGGDAYTSSTNVTLTLSATDAGSGVSQMMISNSSSFAGTTWESYATTKAWSLASGDGTKTVYAKYKDTDGNVSTAYSDTIILDSTVPEVTSLTVNGEVVDSEDTTVTIVGQDSVTIAGKTAASTSVTITIATLGLTCNTTSDSDGNFSCTFEDLSNGSYTVTIRVTNGSGSYSEFSFILGIGVTLPETDAKSLGLLIGILFAFLAVAQLIYIKRFSGKP